MVEFPDESQPAPVEPGDVVASSETQKERSSAETKGFAPIAIFAFRRVGSLMQVLDTLEACPEFAASPVFIFSDAAKDASQAADVAAVRAMVERRLRPNMQLVQAEYNMGLANSIIGGVQRLTEQYGSAIVIEDDLLVSPAILSWFNSALNEYGDNQSVFQISGHMFDIKALRDRKEGLFLPFTTSWGWATWKRAWDKFDPQARGWQTLLTDGAMRKRFDFDGRFAYSKMLKRQMMGDIDSWAIRWYWSVFRENGLSLFPPVTLVENIGNDELATHGTIKSPLIALFRRRRMKMDHPPAMPEHVAVDPSLLSLVRSAV